MFQIAWAESASKKYGIDVCYANLEEHFNTISKLPRSPHAREYLKIFPNLDWYKNKQYWNDKYVNKYVPFHYTEIVPRDGVCYIGYFQSEKFFYDRDFILELFEPCKDIRKYCIGHIHNWGKCFIHVRRTDYLTIPDYHPNYTMNYYDDAIEIMKNNNVKEFLVFSDDVLWCARNFIGMEFTLVKDIDYNELFLMTYCDNSILSNSSFAWWGCWLGDPISVVAPKKWLGSACKDNPVDIIPENWIKI
jgi:hypothetical protein